MFHLLKSLTIAWYIYTTISSFCIRAITNSVQCSTHTGPRSCLLWWGRRISIAAGWTFTPVTEASIGTWKFICDKFSLSRKKISATKETLNVNVDLSNEKEKGEAETFYRNFVSNNKILQGFTRDHLDIRLPSLSFFVFPLCVCVEIFYTLLFTRSLLFHGIPRFKHILLSVLELNF